MNKELYDALNDVMTVVVGMDYDDPTGVSDRAKAVLAKAEKEYVERYSESCIRSALRQRKYAHYFLKSAKTYERLYEMPCGTKPVAFWDAKDALKDGIRWLHAARVARIREQRADEMQFIREAAE